MLFYRRIIILLSMFVMVCGQQLAFKLTDSNQIKSPQCVAGEMNGEDSHLGNPTEKVKGQRKINERIAWCKARLQEVLKKKHPQETGQQKRERRREYIVLLKEIRKDKIRRKKKRTLRKEGRAKNASRASKSLDTSSKTNTNNNRNVNRDNAYGFKLNTSSNNYGSSKGSPSQTRSGRRGSSGAGTSKQDNGRFRSGEGGSNDTRPPSVNGEERKHTNLRSPVMNIAEKISNLKQNLGRNAQKVLDGVYVFGKNFGQNLASGKINIANLISTTNFTQLGAYTRHTLACLAQCGVTFWDLKQMSVLDHTKKFVNCFHRHRTTYCKDLFQYGLLQLPLFQPEFLAFLNNFLVLMLFQLGDTFSVDYKPICMPSTLVAIEDYGNRAHNVQTGADSGSSGYGTGYGTGYGSSYGTGSYGTGYGDSYGQSSYGQSSYGQPSYGPAVPYPESY